MMKQWKWLKNGVAIPHGDIQRRIQGMWNIFLGWAYSLLRKFFSVKKYFHEELNFVYFINVYYCVEVTTIPSMLRNAWLNIINAKPRGENLSKIKHHTASSFQHKEKRGLRRSMVTEW
jgi:hypothetical protein